MNKMPVKRCCEFLEISPQTYYRKVDWLYEQALGFVRERERKLLRSFEMKRLYLSTDRQVHTSNWTKRDDKRNTELLALGTADNISGYVFAWHFNFDPRVSPLQIESETIELGDYDRTAPFRKHARLWLERDFESAQRDPNNTIQADISAKYQSEVSRLNTEAVEEIDNTVKPPSDGMLVHSEYTMYGHFQLLNELFANTEKVRFYLDQEAGIKNAFMGAFRDRVNNHTADAFYVCANKGFTVDQKEQLIQECQRRIQSLTGISFQSMSKHEREHAITQLVIAKMGNLQRFRGSKESWLMYPYATKFELEKE